jgi:opacity protein-like surface antigen
VTHPAPFRRLFVPPAAVVIALAAWGTCEAGGIRDEILDNKYRWGDYAVYAGWYDPQGEQFDEHGSAAYPLGAKIRLRWGDWIRVEGDVSYYRRSGEALFFDIVNLPKFDGLMVAGTMQAVGARWGPIRPYVGGGGVFVSLTNTFGVIVREIEAVAPDNLDKYQVASWNELDFGFGVSAGADIHLSSRVFPFVEYRQLFGSFATDEIRIGAFQYSPEELKTLDGGDVPASYDWSGPVVMAGLKVRF